MRTDYVCLLKRVCWQFGQNSVERIAAGVAVLSYINTTSSIVCASTYGLETTDYLNQKYHNYHFTEKGKITFDY